jgi:type IV pilus assembly protein PilQ
MRLKQLLASFLPLIVLASTAAAASQLTDVKVARQGETTVITLHTSGAFTHTAYRPVDHLLLVDLAGVSAERLEGAERAVGAPGVASYRVAGFRGGSGAQVARLEVTLTAGAAVSFQPGANSLQVHVSGAMAEEAAPAAAEAPAAPARPAIQAAPIAAATAAAVQVQNVGVARGRDGLNIEISGSGPLQASAMRLSNPERVVVDLANAVPATRHRHIAVNSGEVQAVRVAQYRNTPPVTRVVVDLAARQDYEVVSSGNRVTVMFSAPQAAQSEPEAQMEPQPETVAAVEEPIPAAEEPVETAAEENTGRVEQASVTEPSDFVVVQPKYTEKPAETAAEEAPARRQGAIRADSAANRFLPTAAQPVEAAAMLPQPSATLAPQPAVNMAAQQQLMMAQAQPAPRQSRYTGEPISVNLKDVDLRDFFRLVHEISGLNIVLDPNVRGSLTLVLEDVPWDQALDIVLRNNNLERELVGNVLRIATSDTVRKEAEARRARIEAEALAVDKVTVTRFLSYAHAKDVVPTVRGFLSTRGEVIADERTNALIISDIPTVVPEIDRLLQQLDRKTPEVEIEARVIAATRSFARDIGTQLGFGWGNRPSAVGGAVSVGSSPLQVGGLAPLYFTVPTNSIPLFTNMPAIGPTSGLSFTNATSNYRVDAILTMAERRGLLKILSRPRIVTQNNIEAQVRQGLRIPVVTAAQLGGPPTTTYVDAFLRLVVTPQITAENTIFLNVDVENTVPDFARTVGGNPTLITQQATTQVLVSDGGTVVIGGVIQTQNSVSIQQVPLLGDIPILGNLFKRRSVETSTQELIFFITPKIVTT